MNLNLADKLLLLTWKKLLLIPAALAALPAAQRAATRKAAQPGSFIKAFDEAVQSFDTTLLIALVVPAVFCALVILIIVLVLRHVRFAREKLHEERLKMIESGYPLEEPESTKRQQKHMHNAFWISFWMVFLVPSAAFSSAASATGRVDHLGYVLVIWIGASVVSVAAVVCAAVLMICSRLAREDDDEMRMPMKKPS